MSSYLGNFLSTQRFREFPKYPVIWEISKSKKYTTQKFPLGIWEISGNPQCLEIWEIPQTPGIWGIPDKYFGIWGIPQIPENLEQSSSIWESGEYPEFLFSSKI